MKNDTAANTPTKGGGQFANYQIGAQGEDVQVYLVPMNYDNE